MLNITNPTLNSFRIAGEVRCDACLFFIDDERYAEVDWEEMQVFCESCSWQLGL